MPLSAAWCRRPRRFSHRFQRRFYRPIRDILRGHGRRQRGLVPLPKRTDAEEASHDHPEDGPGPTDSDVPVPLSPAKSQYRPLDPARAPVFPPFSPSDPSTFTVLSDMPRNASHGAGTGRVSQRTAGWTAFQNVQLERVPSTSNDDLTPLQPIARTHLACSS